MFLFLTGDLLCSLIPGRDLRHRIRSRYFFDVQNKLDSLLQAFPDQKFKKVKMVKGGWNIGFIIDNQYVFKISKFFDAENAEDKIIREKRITDAFADIVPVKIPRLEIIKSGDFIFYKYEFIPGKNLNEFSLKVIRENREKLGRTLGEFIHTMHHAWPESISDLTAPPRIPRMYTVGITMTCAII